MEAFLSLGLEGADRLAQVFKERKKWKLGTSGERLVINGRKVPLKSRCLHRRSFHCINILLPGPPWRCALLASLYCGCAL